MSIFDLIRPEFARIKNYQPSGDSLAYRFHANELPWSPKTCSLESLSEVALNRYPNQQLEEEVTAELAQNYQVNPQQLLLTRGSDDGIDLVMRLFLRAGKDSIIQCPPTFPMYAFYAQLQQARIINCPLNAEQSFNLSVEKLFEAWEPNCKIVILCQPNNPTGTLLDLDTIADICDYFKDKALVMVDEAYIEFAQTLSATTLLTRFENLMVLRTLSKAWGLAGLRLGSVLAHESLITALKKIMAPYLLSDVVLSLAKKALENKNWLVSSIEAILQAKSELENKLKESSLIEEIYPSRANFLLIKSPYAPTLAQWFAQHQLAVRHFENHPLLHHSLRITVGNQEQNALLLRLLTRFTAVEDARYAKDIIY